MIDEDDDKDDDDHDDDDNDDFDDNDLSDKGEEGGGEVDGTILIYWLVHPKKILSSSSPITNHHCQSSSKLTIRSDHFC